MPDGLSINDRNDAVQEIGQDDEIHACSVLRRRFGNQQRDDSHCKASSSDHQLCRHVSLLPISWLPGGTDNQKAVRSFSAPKKLK